MLNLWRRHLGKCANTLRSQKKCSCPIWAQGTLHGKWIKKSLDVTNWEAAQKIVREWEGGAGIESVVMEKACGEFLSDCEARNLGSASMGKYKLLTGELKVQFKNRVLGSISVEELRDYRGLWKMAPITAGKKLERLRTFFRFCHESGWTKGNPAKAIRPPVVKDRPTLPFSESEVTKILWAVDLFPERDRGRIRAFVDLLRFTGLRIRDATTLRRDRIEKGKLMMYTQKTGTHVYLPLGPELLKELEEVETGDAYYFWTGRGKPKSGVSIWQRTLANLFEKAGIENGHAHRFRDTFSVNLLTAGVSLENVSVLLGHSSIKITEKHYSPWVRARQVALTTEIEKAWKLS